MIVGNGAGRQHCLDPIEILLVVGAAAVYEVILGYEGVPLGRDHTNAPLVPRIGWCNGADFRTEVDLLSIGEKSVAGDRTGHAHEAAQNGDAVVDKKVVAYSAGQGIEGKTHSLKMECLLGMLESALMQKAGVCFDEVQSAPGLRRVARAKNRIISTKPGTFYNIDARAFSEDDIYIGKVEDGIGALHGDDDTLRDVHFSIPAMVAVQGHRIVYASE